MAWETVDLLPLITSDFNGSNYVMEDTDGYRNPGTGYLNDNITPVQIETSFWDSYEANDYIIGDSNAGIRFNGTGNSGISLMLNGTEITTISLNTGWGLKPFVLVAGINRETERGTIFMVNRYDNFPEGASSYSDTYRNGVSGVFLNDNSVYQALTGIIASPYNWETVQSISGKLGTVNLARIKDEYINDGEPVSGAAKSRFSNLKSSNRVSVLIENVLPEPTPIATSVTVKYSIPSLSSGSYTYCKLVIKKDSMPESVTDGDKIVDVYYTNDTVTVNALKGNTKYYFAIFTQDSEGHEAVSNIKSITTGDSSYPPEIQEYLDLINGCNGEGLDFFWKDYTINFPYGGHTDPKDFSYYIMRGVHYTTYNIVQEAFRSGYDDGYRYYTSHTSKFSLWIVDDNGTYKLYFRDYVPFIVGVNCSSFSSDRGLYSTGRYSQDGGSYYGQWYVNSGSLVFSTGDDTVQRSDSSLVSLMEWCSKTFRNVNIYLDGVLISQAN